MNRIDPEQLLMAGARLGVQDQTSVNHVDCPAGVDTKRRLYVKRTNDGLYIGYCHHCGQKGATKASGQWVDYSVDLSAVAPKKLELSRYGTMNPNATEWPAAPLAWLFQARMTYVRMQEHGIRYDEQLDRVALPIFDSEHRLLAMQLRSFDDNQPKYLNVYREDAVKPVHCWLTNFPDDDRIYIVEDILSAIRISKFVNVGALLGTHLSDWAKNYLAEFYPYVAVWLDPDDAGIKACSKIARDLTPIITGYVQLLSTDKQPKELSDEEIRVMVAR